VFSTTNTDREETDIILTLTPYIVRIPDILEDDLQTLWGGTEDNMRLRGPVRGVMGVSPFAEPVDNGKPPEIAPDPAKPYLPPLSPAEESPAAGGAAPAPAASGVVVERDRPAAPVPVVPVSPTPQPPVEQPPQSPPPEVAPAPEDTGGVEEPPPDENAPGEEPPPMPGPATVRLVPSAPSYRVGEPVIVEVRIENGTNVGSVPFHLRYNRQVLEFVPPANQGPFLNADGANTVFLANDSVGGGEVVVGLSRLGGGEGMTGAGTLATFQFQAVNAGDCGFQWTGASVKDPQARNLPASFLTAPVAVEP